MIDSELKALRAAVRAQEALVDRLRRVIHDLLDVNDDPCTDEDCPVCRQETRFQVIEGGRDDRD